MNLNEPIIHLQKARQYLIISDDPNSLLALSELNIALGFLEYAQDLERAATDRAKIKLGEAEEV